METLRDSLPWNVWAGFPLFPSGAQHSLHCLHTSPMPQHRDVETLMSTCDDLTSSASPWRVTPPRPAPPQKLRLKPALRLPFIPLPLFLFLVFLETQSEPDLVTQLSSHADHTHQSCPSRPRRSADPDLTHTLLRHSPLVWPGTPGPLFLLSCHVSRDVRALLCVTG